MHGLSDDSTKIVEKVAALRAVRARLLEKLRLGTARLQESVSRTQAAVRDAGAEVPEEMKADIAAHIRLTRREIARLRKTMDEAEEKSPSAAQRPRKVRTKARRQ